MTYRERRERRAERLRGWADKRRGVATDTLRTIDERYRGDVAFNTQPGHIPERARVIARTDRAMESLHKADSMASRADGIESQLAGAIYSDDPDAVEQLRARIERLEAERDRIKAYNASCRRGMRDLSLLNEREREQLASVALHSAYSLGKNGQYPAYHLSNLNGNLSRQRERLARLERQAEARERVRLTLEAERQAPA